MSNPSQWVWDPQRKEYYYWDPVQLAYIYQNGRVIRTQASASNVPRYGGAGGQQPQGQDSGGASAQPTANHANVDNLSYQLANSSLSGGSRTQPKSAGSPQSRTNTKSSNTTNTSWIANHGARVVRGNPEDITEASLFKKGGVAYGKIRGTRGDMEELDPNYKVRRPGKKFYKVGKVFKVLWPEIAGDVNEKITVVSDTRFINEHFASKIRWFVVVKVGQDCCSCLPIMTYGKQGCAKPGVLKWQHAIIYTGKDEPAAQPGEQPRQGEYSMMQGIRVAPRSRQDKLDPLSRINFAKIYTVEHNVKVYDFGDVHEDSLVPLKVQWKYTLKRNPKRQLDEGESDDEGKVYPPVAGRGTIPTALPAGGSAYVNPTGARTYGNPAATSTGTSGYPAGVSTGNYAGVSTGNYGYPAAAATGTPGYPAAASTGTPGYSTQGAGGKEKGKGPAFSSTGRGGGGRYAAVEEEEEDDDDDEEEDEEDDEE